jgi:hypothetical protein
VKTFVFLDEEEEIVFVVLLSLQQIQREEQGDEQGKEVVGVDCGLLMLRKRKSVV